MLKGEISAAGNGHDLRDAAAADHALGSLGDMSPEERADAWSAVRRRLRAELGEDVFSSWFGRLELDAIAGETARLTVPTRFLKSWIEANYLDRVLSIFRTGFPGVARLIIGVRSAGGAVISQRMPDETPRPAPQTQNQAQNQGHALAAPAARSATPASAPAPAATAPATPAPLASADADIVGNSLDARLCFENFVVGRSNALAHAAAERIASHDGGAPLYSPFFLHAGVGLGKTHLLQAVSQEMERRGRRVIYLTADRFMYGFVNALKSQTALAFKEKLRAIDLLVLDDVQFIQGKSIQQEFGHTVNALIDAGRQIVVAADRPPAELETLDERVRSRLAGGLVVEMGPLDDALRMRILEARIAAMQVKHPAFQVGPEVVTYVASVITTNGRDLDGAVNRLLAHTTLSGGEITVETAENAIRDLVRTREPKRVKIEDIQKLVATRYNVSRADILSERRTAAVVKPRQIAMYLSKQLTLRSLPEIGRRFGGRDHTTVLHAVRKIEKQVGEDRSLSEEVELLKRMLLD